MDRERLGKVLDRVMLGASGGGLFGAGPGLVHVVGSLESRAGAFARFFLNHVPLLGEPLDGARLHGHECFPFRLPVPVAMPAGSRGRRIRARRLTTLRLDCWIWLLVWALQTLYLAVPGGGVGAAADERPIAWDAPVAPPNDRQLQLLSQLRSRVRAFFRESFGPGCEGWGSLDLSRILQTFSDEHGEYGAGGPGGCCKAMNIQADLLCLPPAGGAGVVNVLDVVPPEMRAYIVDPVSTLLPEDEWPERPPHPRVWASDEEWTAAMTLYHKAGMVGYVERHQVFRPRGSRLYNGAFAVRKVKDGQERQRLIANLGLNAFSRRFSGGSSSLGHPAQLTLIIDMGWVPHELTRLCRNPGFGEILFLFFVLSFFLLYLFLQPGFEPHY